MQWDSTTNAGFSNSIPWLPVNENYLEGVNVEAQTAANVSHLSVFKQLTTLRKSETVFANGLTDLFSTVPVFAFARYDPQVTYITAVNVKGEEARVDLTKFVNLVENSETMGEVVIRSSGVTNDATNVGNSVDLDNILLAGYEGIVIKLGRYTSGGGVVQSSLVFIGIHCVILDIKLAQLRSSEKYRKK
eukprot:TRINITY_DN7795_c0_g1_i1.p1 TRINITY_DN7795_c0_g1~~TRINITY_DN7795_c0_g1_i1.p1  ORF type:complete len:189 (-),score=41.88 TRINITY_DN7795_c0_g1_i1:21-587(-)